MGLDISKLNNYELYGSNQKVGGGNPFAGQVKPEAKVQPEQRYQGGQHLDPAMLSEKKKNFENGLGGTNDAGNHKIFYAA